MLIIYICCSFPDLVRNKWPLITNSLFEANRLSVYITFLCPRLTQSFLAHRASVPILFKRLITDELVLDQSMLRPDLYYVIL